MTYRNSWLCSEIVNIAPKKDITYKRTGVFALNLRKLFA